MTFTITDFNDDGLNGNVIVHNRDGRYDMLNFRKEGTDSEFEVHASDLEAILSAMRTKEAWERSIAEKEKEL